MGENVSAVRMTDNATGEVYELDFSRESVSFSERQGFTLKKAVDYPVTGMRDLFYYSFRKNHKKVSREKTDKLFDRWGGGIPERLATRLIHLFQQAQSANAIAVDEEDEKNSNIALEF